MTNGSTGRVVNEKACTIYQLPEIEMHNFPNQRVYYLDAR